MKLVPVFDVTILFKGGNSFTSTFYKFEVSVSDISRRVDATYAPMAPRWLWMDLKDVDCFYEDNYRVVRVSDEAFEEMGLKRELTPDEAIKIDPNFDLGNLNENSY